DRPFDQLAGEGILDAALYIRRILRLAAAGEFDCLLHRRKVGFREGGAKRERQRRFIVEGCGCRRREGSGVKCRLWQGGARHVARVGECDVRARARQRDMFRQPLRHRCAGYKHQKACENTSHHSAVSTLQDQNLFPVLIESSGVTTLATGSLKETLIRSCQSWQWCDGL